MNSVSFNGCIEFDKIKKVGAHLENENDHDVADLNGRLGKIIEKNNISVGIGDISKCSGIPQSKIRYWEQRGYISSLPVQKNQNKRYSIHTLITVLLIKSYLESGFTLVTAVKKAERHEKISQVFKKLILDRVKYVKTRDGNYCINMGALSDDPSKSVVIQIIDGDTKIKLMDTKKTLPN
ncbi:MerR family transcriptional regulator [Fructilactobacillus fructivorans]|nr:MerR family transcriptional regulator [Fructilactobacillus fructivorans]MCT2866961.1 MerR family transcriptional regulator [Fructilactobacillus fructivorans]MCT2869262.1 MerR family transcriptional regulator [Fructilactobacillus fructivorans]MCT2873701.1 MerR family transcriptional regulator [Fructilactobacillus fructivorans]